MTQTHKKQSFTEICSRCGSPKIVSKTWKHNIDTFSGPTEVEISQLVCTNKECQAAFDKNLALDMKRREELKLKKEEFDLKRKESMLKNAREARKK